MKHHPKTLSAPQHQARGYTNLQPK